MYAEEEYESEEFCEEDIYKRAIRSLLLEDDEISENEDAFMDGYEESQNVQECKCEDIEND